MDDPIELIQGRDESLGRVLGFYDTPAYVRRGLQLSQARERVFRRCEAQREERLRWVRMHLKLLRQQIANWSELRNYLASDDYCLILADLGSWILQDLPTPLRQVGSTWGLRSRLQSLIESITRFNRRWVHFLQKLDLGEVNAQVAAYNRYYLLEKECAMRSPRLAAKGFVPACELTREELGRRFPLLPMPMLAAREPGIFVWKSESDG